MPSPFEDDDDRVIPPREFNLERRSLPGQLRYWADILEKTDPTTLSYLACSVGCKMVADEIQEIWNEHNPR